MWLYTVEQLDFERFGYQKGIPRVTLEVIAVLVDDYHREITDLEQRVSWSDEFRSVANSHDVSMSDLSTIKEKIKEGVENGDIHVPRGPERPRRDTVLPNPTPTDELPESYWDNLIPESWSQIAENWEELSEERKNAIPNRYRGRIQQLRRWVPWENKDDDTKEPTENVTITSSDDGTEISEPLEEEAKELLEEMEE